MRWTCGGNHTFHAINNPFLELLQHEYFQDYRPVEEPSNLLQMRKFTATSHLPYLNEEPKRQAYLNAQHKSIDTQRSYLPTLI
jgi:hypothetical protein